MEYANFVLHTPNLTMKKLNVFVQMDSHGTHQQINANRRILQTEMNAHWTQFGVYKICIVNVRIQKNISSKINVKSVTKTKYGINNRWNVFVKETITSLMESVLHVNSMSSMMAQTVNVIWVFMIMDINAVNVTKLADSAQALYKTNVLVVWMWHIIWIKIILVRNNHNVQRDFI